MEKFVARCRTVFLPEVGHMDDTWPVFGVHPGASFLFSHVWPAQQAPGAGVRAACALEEKGCVKRRSRT